MLCADHVKRRARELGFELCGIAPAVEFPELTALASWLNRGFAGRMTYLNRTARKRADVRHVLPSARSVIVVASLYNTDQPYSIEIADPETALIARYAWGCDYHTVMGGRIDALLAWMREASATAFDVRTCVDDGPVQERVYAQQAGIGWTGKHTCVINPELGSWLLLGEIITSLDLDPDVPALDQCGTCTLCIEACPTGAIVEPYLLDARRCLSYLTIEVKGAIPPDRRSDIGSHVFGCDICQDVCPYNATAPSSAQQEWQPKPDLNRPSLAHLWRRSDDDLVHAIEGTPLVRRGVIGLRRNVAVALGNRGSITAASAFRDSPSAREAPSIGEPLVAEHIEWASRPQR